MRVFNAFIPSPSDLSLIGTDLRLNWRVNSILAKAIHQMFLLNGPEDVIRLSGETTDARAMETLSQLLKSSGWHTAVCNQNNESVIYIASSFEAIQHWVPSCQENY